MAACKEGRQPEAQQAKSEAIAPFEWARRQRIVIAMSGEVVAVVEMMRRFPVNKLDANG